MGFLFEVEGIAAEAAPTSRCHKPLPQETDLEKDN
jgi:hypothetical protein